ncbi:unnamed protein product [Lymnaea stagnalis]|uniref:Uncharacterized protein n=1 Tax=Lymnaea stagnalis TaxID=6523 RepID=A0AAV2HQE3_LYMST
MEITNVVLLTLLAALSAGDTQALGLDQAINDTIKNIQALSDKISNLQDTFTSLARQTMSQQLFIEERIRSEGSSGIKQVRVYQHGTSSYFDYTHVGKGVSAIHDHSNSNDTLGMGETVVVINGVEFRTRHNDYRLVQPDESTTAFRAVVNIAPPDVPPEVLNKSTPELQIAEMIEWFKAFKTQNSSLRNYKPYFRPVMCYMEAAWTLDKSIVEPFASDRHNLVADSWIQLQQQIRYTGYTGNKDLKENYSFLPTAIISINDTNGRPLYAQWNYRILCKPFSGDIPTKYFRLQDDLANRESYRFTVARVPELRVARYRLSESDIERFMGFTLLDKIMQEIPGVDNKPPFLNEAAFNQDVYTQEFANYTKLNTGYYHRMFKTGATNAMGLSAVVRGFSDEMLFVAETTQPLIAPVDITICATASSCTTKSSRFTYAIPLEIVYLTPLQTWNPYNLSVTENLSIPPKNGRTGSLTIKEKAFNGTATKVYHYLTPASFYSSSTGEVHRNCPSQVPHPTCSR